MIYNGIYYYFDKNTLGDVVAIRDVLGVILAQYEYDAWGNCTVYNAYGNIDTSATFIGNINPFRYRGYYYDTETGFYYLQTRYYDPTICRFINADDYELVATLSSVAGQLNMYAYCGNNPIMYTDETGESFLLAAIIVGAIIGAVIGGTVAGISAAQNGEDALGVTLAVFEGIFVGGVIGGAVGALVGVAPSIGASLSTMMSGTAGAGAVALTSSYVVAAGATAALGGSIAFAQWTPGSWPGDDPTIPPGDDFIWRGPGEVGSRMGEWYNPKTGDQLHPDIMHPPGKPPHWGWKNKALKILKDIFRP